MTVQNDSFSKLLKEYGNYMCEHGILIGLGASRGEKCKDVQRRCETYFNEILHKWTLNSEKGEK